MANVEGGNGDNPLKRYEAPSRERLKEIHDNALFEASGGDPIRAKIILERLNNWLRGLESKRPLDKS